MKPVYFSIVLMLCVAMLSIPSSSIAFLCGEVIVTCGESTAAVLYKCGENDFVYALTFEDGVFVKEETPTRGYGKSKCIFVKKRSR